MVEKGYIYAAIPPLFRITTKKNEYIYLKDAAELEEYKKTHKEKFLINRNKGLGEMDAQQLWETTMDPAARKMIRITIEDAALAEKAFSDLMGDEVEPRRKYIEEHAKFVKNLDI